MGIKKLYDDVKGLKPWRGGSHIDATGKFVAGSDNGGNLTGIVLKRNIDEFAKIAAEIDCAPCGDLFNIAEYVDDFAEAEKIACIDAMPALQMILAVCRTSGRGSGETEAVELLKAFMVSPDHATAFMDALIGRNDYLCGVNQG